MSRIIRFHKFGAAEVLRCEQQAEPTPTTLEVPVYLNGTAVDASSLDKAASTTKLARADVNQLIRAMSKWASSTNGSKSVRAWNATSSS